MKNLRPVAIAAVVCLALAGTARAQGNGPHTLKLVPQDMNIIAFFPQYLTGNFNPQGTVQLPEGLTASVWAFPITYIRTFSLGGQFGRVFVTGIPSTLTAKGSFIDPRTGDEIVVSRGKSGFMDPAVTLHVGILGAPALTLPEFVKHQAGFQLLGIFGTSVPLGTYDSTRLINLGTNRWVFRVGLGAVTPLGKGWAWESENSVSFFTTNNDVFGPVDTRSQDPLFVSENHVTHNFSPTTWMSLDLRFQYGGETFSDGIPDENKTEILGGGVSLGHQFTRQYGAYIQYGNVLASSKNTKEWAIRLQMAYSF